MRYKGENKIEFSVDDDKNVTVVLGDNTFGKTTIAQAFRWGLYGTIIDTRYSKATEVSLLNNDVLADMTADSRKNVIVDILIVNDDTEYEIVRTATYIRKYPHHIASKKAETLLMRTKYDSKWSDFINNDDFKTHGQVDERIQMMFPKELSNYFFFDGERWGQEKNTKNDIKDSIGTIMGTKALEKMKLHLKEQSKNNVISLVQKKMVVHDDSAEKLTKEKEGLEEKIEHTQKDIKNNEDQAAYYLAKYLEIKELLDKNSRVEDLTKQVDLLEKMINSSERIQKGYYENIIKSFSESYMYFTTPLLDRAVNLLKNVDLEGKDIPDVSDKTIDYLIDHKRCLCGHEVQDKSSEWMHLMRLKDVIPPKAIGTIVGLFQSKLYEWETKGKDIYESINTNAENLDSEYVNMEDQIEEKEKLNKDIDRTINFAEQRRKMNTYEKNRLSYLDKNRLFQQNIDSYKQQIKQIDEKLDEIGTHNADNLKYQRIINYAERLYRFTCEAYKENEKPLFDELNDLMRVNFYKMFNEREKYAKLGEDYKIHLYYRGVGADGYHEHEEFNLSEGELIARNFVFIVSVMELAKKKREKEIKEKGTKNSVVLNLPLVLDGPFSKLSSDNTRLVAQVLPSVAEQVIVFMLDKDWEASGLKEYTENAYIYRINKDSDSNVSTIGGQ